MPVVVLHDALGTAQLPAALVRAHEPQLRAAVPAAPALVVVPLLLALARARHTACLIDRCDNMQQLHMSGRLRPEAVDHVPTSTYPLIPLVGSSSPRAHPRCPRCLGSRLEGAASGDTWGPSSGRSMVTLQIRWLGTPSHHAAASSASIRCDSQLTRGDGDLPAEGAGHGLRVVPGPLPAHAEVAARVPARHHRHGTTVRPVVGLPAHGTLHGSTGAASALSPSPPPRPAATRALDQDQESWGTAAQRSRPSLHPHQ